MARRPMHALRWSPEQECYACCTQGQVARQLRPADAAAWQTWLNTVSSFAFHSPSGSLNVYQEQRARRGQYWYAYHTSRSTGRTRKRYLGATASLTLERLEETARLLADEHHLPLAPTPDAGMALFATKFTPPHLPRALVERPRLLAALDGALSTPLTLLSAAAGWGKTTLLAAWARERQHQERVAVAWLSLADLENNPSCFWELVIESLRCCGRYGPRLGERALALLKSPQPPALSAILTALLQELESREAEMQATSAARTARRAGSAQVALSVPMAAMAPIEPVVVVLDDYHLIEEPMIHESLRFFLEHLPVHLHVILSSRVEPDLPLARLRARGELTEIRMDDLRFREEEAQHLLGQLLSPAPTEDEVGRLTQRTEGWVAGLQLAALALQKRPERTERTERTDRVAFLAAFTGSQRYLLDYVQEDILAHLPTPLRDFLLQVAILSHLDADVCQAVTGAPDRRTCQQLLERLERANLFLAPLDGDRRRYRLHDLFREALLAALEQSQPDLAPTLHRRAARYFEAQGLMPDAIVHRLAAADFDAAACLMEQAAEQFWLHGETPMLVQWVLALPQSQVYEHAGLLLTSALYLLNTVTQSTQVQRTRVHRTVRQLMARVETALQSQTTQAEVTCQESSATGARTGVAADTTVFAVEREACAAKDAMLRRRLRLLRMQMVLSEVIATWDYAPLTHLLPEIEEALSQDEQEEAVWQLVPLACSYILHFALWQTGALLVPRLLEAKARMSRSSSHFVSLKIRQCLAVTALEAGHLRLAAEESQAALDLIEQVAAYALLKGYFELVLAQVWYQWNRLEEAGALLRAVVQDTAPWQHLDVLCGGYVFLLEVELARRAWSAAQQTLDELEQLVQRERYGGYPDWFPTLRAQWWLAQGRLREASEWAASVVVPDAAWGAGTYSAFPVVVRVSFAQQRWQEALELLERWSAHLDRPGNVKITITYLAQLLVALHQTGKHEQARAVAVRLFALTEPEGHLRVYLDEGAPMREALQAFLAPHAPQSTDTEHTLPPATVAYVARLVAAFEQEPQGIGRSIAAAPMSAPEPSLVQQPSPAPVSSALMASLTRREQEVLRLLADGAANQEIAQILMIELSTVKKHVSNVLSKLDAASRTQAVAQARAHALL